MSKLHEDILQTVERLNLHGFIAKQVTESELKGEVERVIEKNSVIGVGGSMTLAELGILKSLKADGYEVISAETDPRSWEEQCALSRQADVMLTSSNAVTQTGVLVNIDGRGNRVANMIYGVETVIFIVGYNKICLDLPAAMERVKNVAAPKNCVRLGRKTPCAVSGKCEDCNSSDRICRATVIQERPCTATKTYVFIVDRELGY